MIGPPDDLIVTPAPRGIAMDVVAEILGSLRLTGCVIVDGQASGDFCLSSRFTPDDCAPFMPSPGQVIAYHYVREGRLWGQVAGHPALEAGPGSILMFPRNDRHLLYTSRDVEPIDSHDILQPVDGGPAQVRIEQDGARVDFFCGFLGVAGQHHPLLDGLPPQLLIGDPGDAGAAWLESSMRLVSASRQSPEMVARIAELFFAQAIRRYIDEQPADDSGWFAALRDPPVARALSVIHARYAEELDVEVLAKEAGVSRSVLGARFAALLGEPPMRYCARWRMLVAANRLREGKDNNANIAYAVGFNSEAAFNRAFKREHGVPPATWRRRQMNSAQDASS